jgi:hypothetical protein
MQLLLCPSWEWVLSASARCSVVYFAKMVGLVAVMVAAVRARGMAGGEIEGE